MICSLTPKNDVYKNLKPISTLMYVLRELKFKKDVIFNNKNGFQINCNTAY